MSNTAHPLVTFALFAYNQERFIREAVEGALAQDYGPLEIILSDDCSTDRTFALMEEIAAEYKGPHLIRLNRNARNLGIADHIGAVMQMVRSDFVVVGAGDDISAPNRTTEMVKVWICPDSGVLSVHSSALEIDERGELTGDIRRGSNDKNLNDLRAHAIGSVGVLGATHGWDMRSIRHFPPMLSSVINEDVVLPARAALMGSVRYIDKPLVKYRIGVGVSHAVVRRRAAGKYDLSIALLKRPYFSLLQKYRDYRFYGVCNDYKSLFACARAQVYFPIWLRTGKMSRRKMTFFLKRCGIFYLAKEWIKFALPGLVSLKQRVQFNVLHGLFPSLKNGRGP
jgi:glycosyltransferase involved in cell wall biosynthesis